MRTLQLVLLVAFVHCAVSWAGSEQKRNKLRGLLKKLEGDIQEVGKVGFSNNIVY